MNSLKQQPVRKSQKILVLGSTGVLIVLLSCILFLMNLLCPVKPLDITGTVSVIVPKNASSSSVAHILYDKGLIKSPLVFILYTRFKGVDQQIKAGQYELSFSYSLQKIINQLKQGALTNPRVTVPEGYTVEQIADLLCSKGLIDRNNFLQEVKSGSFQYDFIENLDNASYSLEGYLFPDTYYLNISVPEHDIIDLMLSRFEEKIKSLNYKERAARMKFTLHEAVTIASIIEKEARVENERPIIASVIENRLRKGMPLQIDATVQYALGDQKPKLYYKDLEINSPYNTYKINGLPPGPIASPGEASLLAVINPAQTEYLYYVAKPDGAHAFARTLDEHNSNKLKYQH